MSSGEGETESVEGKVDDVGDVFSRVDLDIDESEFRDLVEEKVEEMGGLCDEVTAARLVSHDLGEKEIFDIEVRKQLSALSKKEGQVLRIVGQPREGYQGGLEVSASNVEPDNSTKLDIGDGDYRISDLGAGMSGVDVEGRVMGIGALRSFEREDEADGYVSSLVIADDSDWIRVSLWDERASEVEGIGNRDSVKITNGYVRESDGSVELGLGERGGIEVIDEDIEVDLDTTDISEIELDESYTVEGVVTDVSDIRKFERDDGTLGQVRNIEIRDGSSELRVALWGDHAETEVGPGDKVLLINISIQEGWQDAVEGSLNWSGCIYSIPDEDVDGIVNEEIEVDDGDGEGLDSFQ